MAKSSVVHATFVVERTLNATPAEVSMPLPINREP